MDAHAALAYIVSQRLDARCSIPRSLGVGGDMSFRLADVVPWGRSYEEYVAMFALDEGDLARPIVGCGDGPASFNAVSSARGGTVVSCDPIYRFTASEIRSRIAATVPVIEANLRANVDEFVWNRFASVEDVIATRVGAMEVFLGDFEAGMAAGRYVDASLPRLPFADASFDLALCSHFLFLYSEQHDCGFHVASIAELCRVAREARVFPLLELGSRPSRHLEPVRRALERAGRATDVVRVAYEFQKGGDAMLVVRAGT